MSHDILGSQGESHPRRISTGPDFLLIANNGRPFTKEDLLSLCRSAASNKIRGSSIGYRGIGFKSVANIAKEIHIISGNYQITFSRELTKKVIPSATKVPLIRIPHLINNKVLHEISSIIENYKEQNYTTFFIFSGVLIERIENEYKAISNASLLFLKNITEVHNRLLDSEIFIEKKSTSDIEKKITLTSYGKLLEEWFVYSSTNINIAFSSENGIIKRLNRNEAITYAFLPTEDITGLGVLINADFSTDPSRRHLLNDNLTKNNIKLICKFYSKILRFYISEETTHSQKIIKSLAPFSEPSFALLSGNLFEKIFFSEIKNNINFNNYVFRPTWLNKQDFLKITNEMRVQYIQNSDVYPTMPAFLKYLGASELSLTDISKPEIINNIDLSILGSSQIASKLIKALNFSMNENLENLKIFYCDNSRTTLATINKEGGNVDETYLNTLFENGISQDEYINALNKFHLQDILNKYKEKFDMSNSSKNELSDIKVNSSQISDNKTNQNNDKTILDWYHETFNNKEESNDEQISIKTWRNAEQQVMFVLNNIGFRLEDVSTQNLGYDLEGIDPEGNKIYIEIKSITCPGQCFKMTNNEYAVAQIKANFYFIAVAYVNDNILNLALYRNPLKSLHLNRQCVQWVWECNEYTFNPKKFKL